MGDHLPEFAFLFKPTPLLAGVVEYGLNPEVAPPRVAELAARLQVTPRALADRLKHEHLPRAHELLAWCLVYRGVQALRDRRASLTVIAWELGLSNSYALRRMIRRVLSTKPTMIRRWSAEQADHALAEAFKRLISGRANP